MSKIDDLYKESLAAHLRSGWSDNETTRDRARVMARARSVEQHLADGLPDGHYVTLLDDGSFGLSRVFRGELDPGHGLVTKVHRVASRTPFTWRVLDEHRDIPSIGRVWVTQEWMVLGDVVCIGYQRPRSAYREICGVDGDAVRLVDALAAATGATAE